MYQQAMRIADLIGDEEIGKALEQLFREGN
jgi:hypothetical protein